MRPSKQRVDPYGVEGFKCSTCKTEIVNMYKHCMGCEMVLGRDLNFCVKCFRAGRHRYNELGAGRMSYNSHRAHIDLTRTVAAGARARSACRCVQKKCEHCHRPSMFRRERTF